MNFLKKILNLIFGNSEQIIADSEYAIRPISSGYKISSDFGPRIDPITGKENSFHYGVDFFCPEGTDVFSMYEGVVFKVGWQNQTDHSVGFGQRVWIKTIMNGKEYDHFYAHLSRLSAMKGMPVKSGTFLGQSGNTGRSTGPHLHVQLRPSDGSKKGIPITFKDM